MSQGRGSAVVVAITLLLLVVIFHPNTAEAATYKVGGNGGWGFNVAGWTKGKRFRAGDTLVFSYDNKAHNVVAVNKAGYTGCTAPNGARVYQTGNDAIKLVKGQNFFICSFPEHCDLGMKIAITAI